MTLTIPDTPADTGNASFSFDLTIANDNIAENAENFTVTLSVPSGEGTMAPGPNNQVTTTIAANDPPNGVWAISQSPTGPVNEGQNASYTVTYTSDDTNEAGATVDILVTVGFPLNQAVAADIDGDTGTPGPQDLTSALLVNIIRAGITSASITGTTVDVGDAGISATVTLTILGTGNATFSFNLTIADDGEAEVAQTFMVTLSVPATEMTSLGPNNEVTTTIAESVAAGPTPTGTWSIMQTSSATVREVDGAISSYTVSYAGNPADEGEEVSIVVTVGLPGSGQAEDDDIDGVPTTGVLDTLTSARLATIIGTGATTGF